MPYFVLHAVDRPGLRETRALNREAHRAHIRTVQHGCRCVLGGPLLDRETSLDGQNGGMVGTMLVFEGPDLAAVEHFVADDPYTHADLFERVEIHPWALGLGDIL